MTPSSPERRAAPRRPAAPATTSVRLGTGTSGDLLDIGAGGLSATFPVRLLPGREARIVLHDPQGSARRSVRVAWCRVVRITSAGVTYRAGLTFTPAPTRVG